MRRVDAALGLPLQGPDTGFSPYAIATAYDFPIQHSRPGARGKTYDGTGRTVGVAIDSDLLDSDLAAFLSYFKISRTGPALKRIAVDGGATLNGDGVETNLDVETMSGIAPGAGVDVYLMPELSSIDILDTYAKVVEDDKVDVLNSSFGGCEISTDNFSMLSDHVAKKGTAEGITFSASTGDFGANECVFEFFNGLGVSSPSSGPHFTAVGGTSLVITQAAQYRLEFGWQGSGGGVSTIFGLPSFQKGVKNAIPTGRNVPDVSFDANPGTGASLYFQGQWIGPEGGTSYSSPIFSAFVAENNELHGSRSGDINIALYANFKKYGYGAKFRDILYGNNAVYGNFGYNASPGYDDVTGLGSLIGEAYAK